MKPAPFGLLSPSTVDEAAGLLAEHGDDAKVLAGGQSLVPLLALRLARYDHLIDINRIDGLRGISRDDGWLSVGSMTRQAAAERSDEVAKAVPLLRRAIPLIGHFQIRNRGTVGGSIAHADPASEMPAVALALDAELVAQGLRGARTIAARDFFLSTWTTALEPGELLTTIRYPVWQGRSGFAVEEFARRSGDFAIAGVACGVEVGGDDKLARAVISYFGMASTPVRALEAEAALIGTTPSPDDLGEIARVAVGSTEPGEDIHGSASFRRRVAAHLTQVALARAIEETTHA